MKPAETKVVYERACRSKRIVPQDDEGRAWHRVLHDYEARDVQAAIDAWWADTTPTQSGRPRGAFMPEPAELKPLVVRIKAERERRAQQPKDLIVWKCTNCPYSSCGFVPKGDSAERDCPSCKTALQEFMRRAAA